MRFLRRFVLVSFLSLPFFPAFSFEYGFFAGDNTSFKFDGEEYDVPILEQIESLSGTLRIPFDGSGLSYFAMEAGLTHTYDKTFEDGAGSDNDIAADISVFRLSSYKDFSSGRLSVDAGRFFVSDLSGIILSQINDGLKVSFSSQAFDVSAYGGYSGLLNLKNVSVMDSSGTVYSPDDERDFYDFAAPYIVGGLTFSAPYIVFNQTVSAECLAVVGTEGPADSPDDDENRFYGTLSLNGPLSPIVFYNLSASLYSEDFSEFGVMGKAEVAVYPDFKSSSITVSASYASGNQGSMIPFVGFTQVTACLSADEPVYSGIMKCGLAGSMLPVEKLFLSLGGDAVWKNGDDDSMEYYGVQFSTGLRYQMFSDVSLGLSASHFIGDSDDSSRTEFAFNAVISL